MKKISTLMLGTYISLAGLLGCTEQTSNVVAPLDELAKKGDRTFMHFEVGDTITLNDKYHIITTGIQKQDGQKFYIFEGFMLDKTRIPQQLFLREDKYGRIVSIKNIENNTAYAGNIFLDPRMPEGREWKWSFDKPYNMKMLQNTSDDIKIELSYDRIRDTLEFDRDGIKEIHLSRSNIKNPRVPFEMPQLYPNVLIRTNKNF